jgi:hypothetical protein
MMLVLMFIVLFLALLGIVYREVAGAIRIESLHTIQVRRDAGSVHALARALALLETGLPPANPYVCGVTIDTPGRPLAFTVTFATEDGTTWQVQSSPTTGGEPPLPMPNFFGAPPVAAVTAWSLPDRGTVLPNR